MWVIRSTVPNQRMQSIRAILLILRPAGMTVLVLAVFAVAAIHVRQVFFRHQVERLHAEILALQLHPGSFADILRLQREWGVFGSYLGPCTEHHCIYEIEINDGWRQGREFSSSFIQHRWFFRIYPFWGGRPAQASANIRVRDNKMWGADFSFWMLEGPGTGRNNGQIYENIVDLSSGARLSRDEEFSVREILRGFLTREELNCLGCEYVTVHMAPQAHASDIERFNRIQFNCLTGWRSCKHPVDLAPDLWAQSVEDEKAMQPVEEPYCQVSAEILAREANNIVLAQVLSIKMSQLKIFEGPVRMVTARVLEPLKNGQAYRSSDILESYDNPYGLLAGEGKNRKPLMVERAYFFLYRQPPPGEGMFYPMLTSLELRPCHALPNTPDNARSVRQGIALDVSAGEPYDFRNEPNSEQ